MGDAPNHIFTNAGLVNTSVTLHYIEGKDGWTTLTWTDANGNVFNTEPFVP